MTMMFTNLCCCGPPCNNCQTIPMLMTATYSHTDENDVVVCTGKFSDVLRFDHSKQVPFRCNWNNEYAHVDEWEVFPQQLSCLGTCKVPYMQWQLGFGDLHSESVSVRVVVNGRVYNCDRVLSDDQTSDDGNRCPIDATGIFDNAHSVFDCSGGGQIGVTFANSGTWEIEV